MNYLWDDEAGYDYDDPKHPTWADRMIGKADHDRKAAKEIGTPAPELIAGKAANTRAVNETRGMRAAHYEISPREREDEDRRWQHEFGNQPDPMDERDEQLRQGDTPNPDKIGDK